ncbi:hypothetical protein ACTJJ0_27815 [Chitinophaga sp. 22321]|uniref:Cytochrome C and Quinol oxidase polypeptide I n=1 Tax=Chitinophaga hostae TaxID=2831022 RepID=A0ABS5J6T8_9BACT|nr:hypothetical protein [Chitinophaga hostae]MBS0030931.1 hypothetical protein [Chitinophaga hostae]
MFKRTLGTIRQQPYLLFLLAAILLIIISFFERSNTIDIHLHDTMFVVSVTFIIWVSVGCLGILLLAYSWLGKFLRKKTLVWVHVGLTLLMLAAIVITGQWHDSLFPSANQNTPAALNWYMNLMYVYALLVFLFLAAQLVFIAHLLYSLLLHLRKK